MHARGYIDGIFEAAVRGWVVDLDDPANVLRVAVRVDGQQFAPVAADEPRADLAKAGIANGSGGFRVQIGTPPVPGAHEIVAVVDGTRTVVPLAKDFRVLDAAGEPRADVALYEGVAPPAEGGEEVAPREAKPGGEPALAGEAGWLFRCPEDTFDLICGVAAPDPAALDALAAQVAAFQADAGAHGTACLVAVVPDKLHVYPDHAPQGTALYPAGRVAEHLAARVQDTDDGVLLDLLPTLLRARAHGRVFSRAGTGPTWLGAFHAYRAIAKLLATALPALRPRPIDALVLGDDEPVIDAPHDGPLLRWQGKALVPDGSAAGLAATAVEPALSPGFPRDAGGKNAEAPRALLVHDGTTRRVAELLGDHCAATLTAADDGDPGPLPADRLDLAVWLLSDRTLARMAIQYTAG